MIFGLWYEVRHRAAVARRSHHLLPKTIWGLQKGEPLGSPNTRCAVGPARDDQRSDTAGDTDQGECDGNGRRVEFARQAVKADAVGWDHHVREENKLHSEHYESKSIRQCRHDRGKYDGGEKNRDDRSLVGHGGAWQEHHEAPNHDGCSEPNQHYRHRP